MSLKIAIHHREDRDSYSFKWIEICKEKGYDFEIVNCFNSDIVSKLKEYDILLWHWPHFDSSSLLVATQIINSLKYTGIKIFPDINTCWHFDDKVAQKYLLEAIDAPLVPTHTFFSENEALNWANNTSYPKVFKLRCGAGSTNVKLIKNIFEARTHISKAFNKGFISTPGLLTDAKTKFRNLKSVSNFIKQLKRVPSVLKKISVRRKFISKQIGYIYFQDFIENNTFDTRISVIGGRAFGFIRKTRPNDFRASGSGEIDYDLEKVDKRCVEISLKVAKQLKTQSLAFDFVFDANKNPLIVEISYAYMDFAIYDCEGYWDTKMNWVPGHFWPQDLILQDLME
jgi:glutathione synthase/RimK-type ligase-like ATP-grasp enzyme